MMHVLSYYCLFTSWLICIKNWNLSHVSQSILTFYSPSLLSLFSQIYLPTITFTWCQEWDPTATTYQISTPEPFDCANSEEWTRWVRRFERFRSASGLAEKSGESQVNTLVYAMGDAGR